MLNGSTELDSDLNWTELDLPYKKPTMHQPTGYKETKKKRERVNRVIPTGSSLERSLTLFLLDSFRK